MTKTIFRFGKGLTEGNATMKELLGGKGANLAAMGALGLPVPPGVTITTEVCTTYQGVGEDARSKLRADFAKHAIKELDFVEKEFGYMPLLSVRSGARVSMPGMMDTILNVGLTIETMPDWVSRIGPRAAWDCRRRLVQMYAAVVVGIPMEMFDELLGEAKKKAKVKHDADLTWQQLKALCKEYEKLYTEVVGDEFPDTLAEQLAGCIGAVFDSWGNERAREYRIAHQIPEEWGTAVNVQAMVFGNMNDASATGVLFTRNPSTGEPGLYGEFLVNAQGEDVVAGIRTPEPIAKMKAWNQKVWDELEHWAFFMEAEHKDMQDMEFTVQDGSLYMLQTRTGKRSASAAFRIANDLLDEGVIDADTALKRVTGRQYMALKRPRIADGFKAPPAVVGLPAAGSVVTGKAVFSADEAKAAKGPVVLVTKETTPDDFGGMLAAVGILTCTGGATSHAAVVARGMDKTCVVGATELVLGMTIKAGDTVTLDGVTGRVWVNVDVPVVVSGLSDSARYLLELAKSKSQERGLRITLTPTSGSDKFLDCIPESGWVVLDLSELLLDRNPRRRMRQVLRVLDKRPGLRGVLDFAPAKNHTHPEDQTLLDMLGMVEPKPEAPPIDVAKVGDEAMCLKRWTQKLMSRWVVHTPQENLLQTLIERGWNTLKVAAGLKDLMSGEGLFSVDPQLEGRLLQNEGVKLGDFIKLLQASGRQIDTMPEVVDEDEHVFAVLGK